MPTPSFRTGRNGPKRLAEERPSRAAFALGTGRCGTHLLHELLAGEPSVSSHHELNPMNEAFHRYCQWNELPVDDRGFLEVKAREIALVRSSGRLFFESSSHLSLSARELYRSFGARFILMTRDPIETVCSLWGKGWYEEEYRKHDPGRAVGFHDLGNVVHFLGRPVPNGREFARWSALSRAGKLAWYWSALNERVLTDLRTLPEETWITVKLEELDYSKYMELARFLGISSALTPERFAAIAGKRPGASWSRPRPMDLSEAVFVEVVKEVGGMAAQLGYSLTRTRSQQVAITSQPRARQALFGSRAGAVAEPGRDPKNPVRKRGPEFVSGALPPRTILLSFKSSTADPGGPMLRGLECGIRGYHVRIDLDAGGHGIESLMALSALRAKHSLFVLLELQGTDRADTADLPSLITGSSDLVLIGAGRHSDFLSAQNRLGLLAPPAAVSLNSCLGLLHWRDLLRSSSGAVVWRTELRCSIDEADLDHWILSHHMDALKQNKLFCVALDAPSIEDPESMRAVTRMASAGLSILVPSEGGPTAWKRTISLMGDRRSSA